MHVVSFAACRVAVAGRRFQGMRRFFTGDLEEEAPVVNRWLSGVR